jgi:hypothetical protein
VVHLHPPGDLALEDPLQYSDISRVFQILKIPFDIATDDPLEIQEEFAKAHRKWLLTVGKGAVTVD